MVVVVVGSARARAMSEAEYSDQSHLLRAASGDGAGEGGGDLEAQGGGGSGSGNGRGRFRDLLKHLDRRFSGRRHSSKRLDRDRDRERDREREHASSRDEDHHFDVDGDVLGDSAPPEWALLLIGCLLGLATGLFVAAFNNGVSWDFSVCPFWIELWIDTVLVFACSFIRSFDLGGCSV